MLLNFQSCSDNRGSLTPINIKDLPFEAKRIFYVSGVPKGGIRGKHAHKTNKQVLVCVSGSIEVFLDDGNKVESYTLNENDGIFIDQLIWDEQKYLTGNDILISICSNEYDESDYIRDYKQFKELA